MKKFFVDSNVFLRYYSSDDAKQGEMAKELLLRARDREITLFCGPPYHPPLCSNATLNLTYALLALPHNSTLLSPFLSSYAPLTLVWRHTIRPLKNRQTTPDENVTFL